MDAMLAEHSNISFEDIFIYCHHFLVTVADLKITNPYKTSFTCLWHSMGLMNSLLYLSAKIMTRIVRQY
ncbi:hypothetical protein LH428_04095 [Laribacter hongkongensis]|uniref:hypothetical protein n=1 Tax=Laribacter hongkongensis TaxID=168471 RepID=UPI001EFE1C50|nr:hypothetical protein [Laribacter hongkongensis]MCG9115034.1 hypothetical protein [Laribacter hongkongensis]